MSNNLVSSDQKSLFELESFDKSTYDRLFVEYNENESLFRFYLPYLHNFFDECDISPEVAQIWYLAKKFIQKLCTLNYPESYIERIESALYLDPTSIDFSNAVLMCMYEMMKTSGANSNHHFDKAIDKIESKYWKTNVGKKEVRRLREDYPDDQSMWSSERDVINSFMMYYLRNVPAAIEQGEMTDDYDYSKPDPFFTANEDTDGQEAEDKIPVKKGDIKDDKIFPKITIDQKVRMEVVCRFYDLIECAYLKPKKQIKAAELMAIITDIPISTCNSYLSNRRNGDPVSKDFHQKEFDRIYQLYEELKISVD